MFLAWVLFYFILSCIPTLFLWILYVLLRARWSPLQKDFPGKQLWNPFVGNLSDDPQLDLMDHFCINTQRYGRLYRYYMFLGKEWLIVTDPEAIKYIMVTNSSNYVRGPMTGAQLFERIVGKTSMLLSDGDIHRRHRTLISPPFRVSNLRKLIPYFQNQTEALGDFWLEMIGGDREVVLDIRREMNRLTLSVIGFAGFGVDFDCIRDNRSQIAAAMEKIVRHETNVSFFLHLPFVEYIPFPRIQQLNAGIQCMEQLFKSLLKKGLGKENAQETFLGMILPGKEDEEVLSNQELRDEMMTFIVAGHETASLALTYTLLLLALHPEVQEKARIEVFEKMREGDLDWETLESLSYTKAVIYEALRLYTPIPFTPRTAIAEDFLLGYRIPAGTALILHFAAIHRLPDIWKESKAFLPDRFLEGDAPLDAWMPFGEGHHKCLGYKFALMEILSILVLLLRRFRFRPVNDSKELKLQVFITLQPIGGVKLAIERL